MGIQINGQTDTISAIDGALTVSGADLPTVTNLNATGIVTATGFVGNITGNINATGVSTIATLNITQSNPTRLNVSGVSTFTSGPVLIGSGTSTGTASQTLQVTGGTYISGNLGIGNSLPSSPLDVQGGQIRIRASGTYSEPTDNAGVIGYDSLSGDLTISARSSGGSTAIAFRTSNSGTGAEKLRIDSRGIVTIPNQPAFHATGTGTQAFSGAQTDRKITIATNITPNTSNSYANSRFTAPVAGNYLFYLSSATTTATSSGPAILLYKNGVATQEIALNYTNASYSQFGGSIIRSAVKDDYFEFYITNYNSTSFTIDLTRTSFGGYLIG
jgi:hypothetical protein